MYSFHVAASSAKEMVVSMRCGNLIKQHTTCLQYKQFPPVYTKVDAQVHKKNRKGCTLDTKWPFLTLCITQYRNLMMVCIKQYRNLKYFKSEAKYG